MFSIANWKPQNAWTDTIWKENPVNDRMDEYIKEHNLEKEKHPYGCFLILSEEVIVNSE